jgi:hypothetical protein
MSRIVVVVVVVEDSNNNKYPNIKDYTDIRTGNLYMTNKPRTLQ